MAKAKEIVTKIWCAGMANGAYIVTPAMAKEWLTHNRKNYRVYKPSWAKKIANDILSGNWHYNGESICFCGKTGELQDGQHRLNAIVIANVPVKVNVCFDADETSNYNWGNKRTVKTALPEASALDIATGRIVVNGGITNMSEYGEGFIKQYVETHLEELKKATSIVATSGKVGKKAACAAVVYCYVRNGELSEQEMRSFFKVMNSGNIVGADRNASSALVVRKQFEEMDGGGYVNQKRQFETIVKAMNDYHTGTCRCRRYTDDTTYAEKLVKSIQVIDNIH